MKRLEKIVLGGVVGTLMVALSATIIYPNDVFSLTKRNYEKRIERIKNRIEKIDKSIEDGICSTKKITEDDLITYLQLKRSYLIQLETLKELQNSL